MGMEKTLFYGNKKSCSYLFSEVILRIKTLLKRVSDDNSFETIMWVI